MGKPREALHSFQFRHVSGMVQVVVGDVVPYGHPAVRHKPDWFKITDDVPSEVDPVDGDDNPDIGEE